tara:strand:- start:2859 stop:5168 length:2310 start_codon:yes stop_codon:yes gene_type:complete
MEIKNTAFIDFKAYNINNEETTEAYAISLDPILFKVIGVDGSSEYDIFDVLWIFGDGEQSTDVQPLHYFKESGIYTVQLYIYNRSGARFQSIKEINITVTNFVETAISIVDSNDDVIEISSVQSSSPSDYITIKSSQSYQHFNNNAGYHSIDYNIYKLNDASDPINGDIFNVTYEGKKFSHFEHWNGLLKDSSSGGLEPVYDINIKGEKLFCNVVHNAGILTISFCNENNAGAVFCGTQGSLDTRFYTDANRWVGIDVPSPLDQQQIRCSLQYNSKTLTDRDFTLDGLEQRLKVYRHPSINSVPINITFNILPYWGNEGYDENDTTDGSRTNILRENGDVSLICSNTGLVKFDVSVDNESLYSINKLNCDDSYTSLNIPLVWTVICQDVIDGSEGFNVMKIIDQVNDVNLTVTDNDVELVDGDDYIITWLDIGSSNSVGHLIFDLLIFDQGIDLNIKVSGSANVDLTTGTTEDIVLRESRFKVFSETLLPDIIKKNETFNVGEFFDDNTFQTTIKQSSEWMRFISNISGAGKDPNGFLIKVNERIANFTDNHANIDTCNVGALLSHYKGINERSYVFDRYSLNLPPNISRLVDILSIHQSKLVPIRNKFRDNINNRGHEYTGDSRFVDGINIGVEVLDVDSYTFSKGVPIVLQERYTNKLYKTNINQIQGFETFNSADIGIDDILIDLWSIPMKLRDVGDTTNTITLINKYFRFYEYKDIEQGSQIGGEILSDSLPSDIFSVGDWEGDNGIIEQSIARQIILSLKNDEN